MKHNENEPEYQEEIRLETDCRLVEVGSEGLGLDTLDYICGMASYAPPRHYVVVAGQGLRYRFEVPSIRDMYPNGNWDIVLVNRSGKARDIAEELKKAKEQIAALQESLKRALVHQGFYARQLIKIEGVLNECPPDSTKK